MDALIDSIVQSDASDGLTTVQLHALIGLVGATPTVLPSTHAVFQRLSSNLAHLTETAESLLSLRLALLLCAEVSHRDVVFAMVEMHGDAIDAAVVPHVAALTAQHPCEAPFSTGSPNRSLLSCLFLVVVASGGARVTATDVVEFVDASVEAAVHLLVLLYADVCGVVPGAAPVVTGALQSSLSHRLVQLLHELTFWTTYEALHARLGIGSRSQVAASRNTADTPLQVSAGPYRHHVGQIIAHVLRYDWCPCAAVHMARLAQAALQVSENAVAQLRGHFSLIKSLLTLTDQYVAVLRKALFKAGILEHVCEPLLRLLASQRPLTAAHVALLQQCVDVTATLSFRSGEGSHHWDTNRPAVVKVVEDIAADPASLVSACDERALTELVRQLVRLTVNAHATAAAAEVLRLWHGHLNEADRQRVAHSLSNPSSRTSPVDIFSPAYEVLRCVFKVDSGAPVASTRAVRGAAAPQRGGRQRHRSRSRGRGRGEGRGQRSRSRRSRPSRRQRMKRRFQLLAKQTSPIAEPDALAQELADTAATDSDSQASDSDETEVEAAAAVTLPDVSRWRRGPPPRSIPTRYICALSHALIRSTPVVAATGYVFDEDIITDYLQFYHVCPVSGEPLSPSNLVVDTQLKEELSRVRDNFC